MENLNSKEGSTSGTKAVPSLSDIQEQGNEGTSVAIEIPGLDPHWVTSINERFLIQRERPEESSISFSCSVHRVPHCLRQYNEAAYEPQVISIGPLHYQKRKNQLHDMEEHKWRYINDFLSRSQNREGSLEKYLAAVKKLEERARKCYSEEIKLDSNSFVEMMVLDGFFIIEFFHRDSSKEEYKEDPIFASEWLHQAIHVDLMMLENQIPFFVLQRLYDLTGVSDREFFSKIVTSNFSVSYLTIIEKVMSDNIQHLLHLLHTILVLSIDAKDCEACDFKGIPSASKLEEGGIKFKVKRYKDPHQFFNIQFDQKGVIEIPSVQFWDKEKLFFLNLIAFEQCYCPCKKCVTAYIAFMNCLISTKKDIEILCRAGIIFNWLGNGGDVAALFSNVVRELTVRREDFYLSGHCDEINRYFESPWPRMRATLVHDYFRNPWAIISFLGALLLLLFTMIQAFFSSFPKFAYGK